MQKEAYLPEITTPKEKCQQITKLYEYLINAGWSPKESHIHAIHELHHALAIPYLPGKFGVITNPEGDIISTSFKPSRLLTPDEEFVIAAANPEDMSYEDLQLMANAYKKGR